VTASVDWATVSSLATAGGTLILAIATFASVRSANRAARTAERAFQVGLRPLLFPSRPEDAPQKIRWGDDHWANVGGGRATVERVEGIIYLAMSLRNVGSGNAFIRSWHTAEVGDLGSAARAPDQRPVEQEFRAQGRDMFVPTGDVSFWQAAIRDDDDPMRPAAVEAIDGERTLFVDILYSDYEGGQPTISRFLLTSHRAEQTDWHCSVVRHWNLDRPDLRD
jgi:hypothetical protein